MNHKSNHNKGSMSNRVFVVLQGHDFINDKIFETNSSFQVN